jgi:hypothetical protein
MNSSKRRKLLAMLASTLVASALPCARAARAPARPGNAAQAQPACAAGQTAHIDTGADALLLQRATEWVDGLRIRGQTILPYPVSRLQREFLIGYNRTWALAETLARQGEWTIAYMGDGTRYARLHPRVAR